MADIDIDQLEVGRPLGPDTQSAPQAVNMIELNQDLTSQ